MESGKGEEDSNGKRVSAPPPSSIGRNCRGACSVLVGAVSGRFVDEVVQYSRSWQRIVAALAGLAVARTFYSLLGTRGAGAAGSVGKDVPTPATAPASISKSSLQEEREKVEGEEEPAIDSTTQEEKEANAQPAAELVTSSKPEGTAAPDTKRGTVKAVAAFCDGEEKKEEVEDLVPPAPPADDGNNKTNISCSGSKSLGGDEGGEDRCRGACGGDGASFATAPAHLRQCSPESLAQEEPIVRAQKLAQRENVESDKLHYLRREVAKLKSKNSRMQNDLDYLKDSNHRLREANNTAGKSFGALNTHIQELSKTNDKISSELAGYKQQVQKLSMSQAELREELKLKQATYSAEVQSRLQYQKLVSSIVDMVQDRCRDTRLVEDILSKADAWDDEQSTMCDGGGSVVVGGSTVGPTESLFEMRLRNVTP